MVNPEHTPDPGAVVRMPPMMVPAQRSRGPLVAVFAGCVIVALLIGIGIGRATMDAPAVTAPTTATPDRGRLKVLSIPTDGNVTLDGRFVGVAPLEGLDLDPGKHSIVIDAFGYQPYSGTVEIEKHGNAKLTAVLAPLGGTETTTGKVSGGGTATRVTVPASALQPSSAVAGGAGAGSAKPSRPEPAAPRAPAFVPPPRPRRDCSGENSTCRDGCSRADSDCRFSCPGCTSCLTSVGWDECKRQCDTCRNGCEQNNKFCESSCKSQQSNCEATQ